jgi:predicted nucleic acid-binding protein
MTAAPCVVDTSAWIEWLAGTALGKRVSQQFPDKPQWIVPTIVQLELSKWLVREVGEEQADQVIAFTQKCVVVALDTVIALLAADFHREYKLATADAIVYATARRQGATLLTCDAHFDGLPGIVLLAKGGGTD